MSHEGPRFPHESKPDKEPKKKPSRKVVSGASSVILSAENKAGESKAAKTEPSAVEKMLAELTASSAEQAPEPAARREKTPEKTVSETVQPVVEAAEKVIKAQQGTEVSRTQETDKDDEEAKDYEPLPIYEPAPVEFSGGEVIIHLNDDRPVAERILPLQHETDKPETSTEQAADAYQVFMPQPLQQHRARQETPFETAGGSGGDIPPTPPTGPEATASGPPEPPESQEFFTRPVTPVVTRERDPMVNIYASDTLRQRDLAPFGPSNSEKPASKQDVEDALYYAEKAGKRQGLLTGLFVGGVYEHFKHKRREKKTEKLHKQEVKRFEQASKDQTFREQEQTTRINESDRQYARLEKRLENGEAANKLAAKTEVQQPVVEQLKVPEDHRIETSAWHSIEVDAKTGKVVENPAFEYGREYYRERAQETAPVMQRNAAAGEIALVAAATASGQGSAPDSSSGDSPAPAIPDASTQGPPSSGIKATAKASAQKASSAVPGPVWPWLVALAAIIILLAILIH